MEFPRSVLRRGNQCVSKYWLFPQATSSFIIHSSGFTWKCWWRVGPTAGAAAFETDLQTGRQHLYQTWRQRHWVLERFQVSIPTNHEMLSCGSSLAITFVWLWQYEDAPKHCLFLPPPPPPPSLLDLSKQGVLTASYLLSKSTAICASRVGDFAFALRALWLDDKAALFS